MTTDEIRAYGEIYGILASVLPLTVVESKLVPFDPAGQLSKAVDRRVRKISEEVNLRIAEVSARISPNSVRRLTQEETGTFWIGFYAAPRPVGRPCMHGEKMIAKTIKVPAELWDKAAEKAAQDGSNMSELIRRKLTEYVD